MASKNSVSDFLGILPAVILPGLQAIVSGFAIGVSAGSLSVLFHSPNPLAIGALTGGVSFGIVWLIGLSWWRSKIESFGQGQTQIVYPSEVPMMKISIDWDSGRAGIFDDLNVSDTMFIDWACQVGRGKSLGENHHTGAANPFSKGQYHAFIDRLEYHGFVRLKGKARTSGYILTGKGRAVCQEVLRRYGSLPNPYPASQKYLIGQ